MTAGPLLFAVATAGCIRIWLEERDLVDLFGDQYPALSRTGACGSRCRVAKARPEPLVKHPRPAE